jgi:hypothetical protein
MRVVLPLIALALTTAASPPPERVEVDLSPGLRVVSSDTAVCRDRIQEVRRELGKPELRRDAAPEAPLLIAAVDKRIGGCSVMVMRNDTSDIRPLPAPREHRLMPAR